MSQCELERRDPALTGTELTVIFSDAATVHQVESVLDLDPEGFVIGIEILGIISESQLARSPDLDDMKREGVLSVSIDPDSDAMYIRLATGTSTRQVVRPAVLAVAAHGTLAAVHVLPPL